MVAEIGIGAAHFGFSYGVLDKFPALNQKQVSKILEKAMDKGVTIIDTAQSYGDSEKLIGNALGSSHNLRIVSKLKPLTPAALNKKHKQKLSADLDQSLINLRTEQLHGFLIHDTNDIRRSDIDQLIEFLLEEQSDGKIKNIGVSIYEESDLARIDSSVINIVQIPFNILDRQLAATEKIVKLHKSGASIHARSIYLQGLLLQPPHLLPSWATRLSLPIKTIHKICEKNFVTPQNAAISYAATEPIIDVAFIGVAHSDQLSNIEGPIDCQYRNELEALPIVDRRLVDPRLWPVQTEVPQ